MGLIAGTRCASKEGIAKEALKNCLEGCCSRRKQNGPANDLMDLSRMLGKPVEIRPFDAAVRIEKDQPISTGLGGGQIALPGRI